MDENERERRRMERGEILKSKRDHEVAFSEKDLRQWSSKVR